MSAEESLLSPEEEHALLLAADDESNSSSSSSSSRSTESTWASASSSSSSNSEASSSTDSDSCGKLGVQISCDETEQTKQIFTANIPSLYKERGIPVEKVQLHHLDLECSGWKSRDAFVAVSEQPVAVGAMRAAFLLADLTPQLGRDILLQLRQKLRAEPERSGVDAQIGALASIFNQHKNSFDSSVLDALLDTTEGSASMSTVYVAKAYRRYLVKRSTTDDKASLAQEEFFRHVRDAHMSAVANHWANQLNKRNVAPKISFLPVYLLVREKLPPQNGDPSNNRATSRVCEVLSVEPLLDSFKKINNNAGWVSKNQQQQHQQQSSSSGHVVETMLEREIREAGNALVHFSYQMSNRTLLLCDIQGSGSGRFTDPQIHTLNAQSFGTGNLGPRGMYRTLLAHSISQCNKVCRKLGLEPLDMEREKEFLKGAARSVKSGNLHGAGIVHQVQMPSVTLPSQIAGAGHGDFDF